MSCRPWFDRSGDHAPFFGGHTGRRSVGFEIRRVDHHGRLLAVFCRQPGHHPREDAFLAPPLPTAVERLVRTIGSRRIAPPQAAVAIDEDKTAQHPLVICQGLPVSLGKERSQTGHLCVGQPEKVAHITAPFSER